MTSAGGVVARNLWRFALEGLWP